MEKKSNITSYLPIASSESSYLCSCCRAESFLPSTRRQQTPEETLCSLDSSGSCLSSSNRCCYSWKKSSYLEIIRDISKSEEFGILSFSALGVTWPKRQTEDNMQDAAMKNLSYNQLTPAWLQRRNYTLYLANWSQSKAFLKLIAESANW